MSDYSKATDFGAKDALLTGDPNKVIYGEELDDEFDAIQTAVNSKSNTASPTFTGTVTLVDLTATGLSTQASEATAVMINGSNVVGTRELGSNAFTSTTYIEATDVTFENLNTNGDVGTGAAQVAAGNHTHTGVYEPADSAIVKSDEAETITASWTFSGTQTFSDSVTLNGEVVEKVYTSSSTSLALDPGNGVIQHLTPATAPTYTDSLADGEYVTLMLDVAQAVTWPTILWAGGSAPTLDTTNMNVIELWKVGSTLYGAYVGAAS